MIFSFCYHFFFHASCLCLLVVLLSSNPSYTVIVVGSRSISTLVGQIVHFFCVWFSIRLCITPALLLSTCLCVSDGTAQRACRLADLVNRGHVDYTDLPGGRVPMVMDILEKL